MADFDTQVRVIHDGAPIVQLRENQGQAQIRAGRQGIPGIVDVFNSNNRGVIVLEGERGIIGVGQEGTAGEIRVRDANDKKTIILDGASGDIILANADCAEEFDIAEDVVEAGSVMVVDSERTLRICDRAYDKRVAGVISGAGDYRPGIILDRQSFSHKRMPIAVVGKVYCKVDARYGAVEVGDLLTTSPTPGHAMRADNPTLAFGSVIGKALQSLNSDTGLVALLVALQ